ncbi:MAG: hypothetical protein IT330_14185 [Anaerolineae bacterium]|nr:hypothetical protein [Anaerolineae bacterium]
MGEASEGIKMMAAKSQEQVMALVDKLIATARPSAVYGEPVKSGNYTVITASEVTAAGGFGLGSGSYTGPMSPPLEAKETKNEGRPPQPGQEGEGGGGGGGGGGAFTGRPVAVITIGPAGVEVQPVVDPTKMALAFFTALGAMFMMWGRMRKASRG